MKTHMMLFSLFFCLLAGETLTAQNMQVSGTVSDYMGPMVSVTVRLQGTGTGTVTDMDGKYSLQVPTTGTLEFSFMGYETQTVKINKRSTIDITMKETSETLDEVVVVGYGTVRKRDITGSISSINEKDIQSNQPINLGSALQGKISGLDIMGTSEPGTASTFRIRGASSLGEGGSNPLFIVDGMEVASIESINPRDIASIEVLKDAASAAIYGSRSANGVILITTKQGIGQLFPQTVANRKNIAADES